MHRLSDDYLARFAEAVVQEIWNELGRQRITSLRELARRAGMTHTAVIVRMNGDSRTGKKVVVNVRDLAAFGQALGVEPGEFVARAKEALDSAPVLEIRKGESWDRFPDEPVYDPSSLEGSDIAARDEDREKPRLSDQSDA